MKIKDRLLLGFISGLGGNMAKNLIEYMGHTLKMSEVEGAGIASAMFISPHKIYSPEGKLVGYIADNIIAGILGIGTVYMLSATGKDKAVLKGALTGQAMWQTLYGVLATMGASRIESKSPKTTLCEFIAHTVYGAVTSAIAVSIGDEGIFTGKVPLSASAKGNLI